jgi:hypothetical protein
MHQAARLSPLLVAVILTLVPAPLLADDVESGWDGDQIVPIDSKAIRMASERVDVTIRWPFPDMAVKIGVPNGHAVTSVTGLFVLVNESNEPQSIHVSFPGSYHVKGFARTVDGQPVKVEERPGGEFGNVSKIAFAPRQERTVRVKYTGYSDATSGYYCGGGSWAYILKTGARWKGTIGKAIIAFHFPPEMPPCGKGPFDFAAVQLNPPGYLSDDRTATWEFSDFKPCQDISFEWNGYRALSASDPFKLRNPRQAAALLLEQGRVLENLQALAAIREFFPDSPQARTLDYDIARALTGRIRYRRAPKAYAAKAAVHYEAALKQPLDAEQRLDALTELYILYSGQLPDPAKAQKAFDRLKGEPVTGDVLRRIATLSPRKAMNLLDALAHDPYGEGLEWGIRAEIQRMLKAHPDGLVGAKSKSQTQPSAMKGALSLGGSGS